MSYDPQYNPYSLQGKTVLITGASSGIGRATAVECARLGARCVITGRDEPRLQQTLESLPGDGHMYIIADLSTQCGVDKLVETMPNVDGLVNNAGAGIRKPVGFYKQEDLERIFQINTFTPMLLTKAILRKKKLNRGGAVIFTSSVAALTSQLGNGIYGASKSALATYMRYCAFELAEKNIRANAVLPGMVDTPFIHQGRLAEEDMQKDMQENYPLKRYGRPEDIAHAIIYLLSDAASWVTGVSLIVDGGHML